MTKKKTSELVSLSFFSGCGGLDLGLAQAGIEQRLVCDFDKACRRSLAANYPDLPVLDNILNYSAQDLRKIAGLKAKQRPTLVVGGPPCQAFSTAGKRQGFTDPRGNVFLHYVQLIQELEPDYAVIENVRGLLSAPLQHRPHQERGKGFPPLDAGEQPGGALAYVINELESAGYSVSFNLYNAANYGVPQVRERVILIAARGKSRVPYLTPTHAQGGAFGLTPWRSFLDAVQGLDAHAHTGVKFPEERIRFYRLLKPGQYWKHLKTPELQMQALGASYFSGGGKTGFLRRIAWDKPCPTLVTHPAMPATDLAHPEQDRPLSVEEYRRVQMFPDHWIIEGSVVEKYKQIGNAVPVGLGYALGKTLLDHMNGQKPSFSAINFPYSRYKNTDDISWRQLFGPPKPIQKDMFNLMVE
jgi:DNA (cytosine-5)-methyltransferase 1